MAGFSTVLAGLFLALVAVALFALVAHRPAKATSGWWLLEVMSRTSVRQALLVSFESTTICALAIVALGTPVALLLARPFRGREVLEAFVSLPVVLPPVVAGLALLLAFGRRGLLGHALDAVGIHIPFSLIAVVMAQTLVAAPLYIIAAKNAFERADPDLVDAAATLRASYVYTALRVIVPPALPALGAALALAWARALGEFGATITFAGNLPGVTQTMPIAVYVEGQGDIDAAVAISLILLAVSFVVLAGARLLQARVAAA
ncbi:MAG: molybdate ABC transporter permease subunit [Candidatus Eremiobacteraeota bacterium]|nr:molybdate ABC transporter permease subunit [Candidatus Eremiobacteraeota bacterium]